MDTIILPLLLWWGRHTRLVARSLDSRSIYDARLSDVEMQERQRRRETRASAGPDRSQKPGFPTQCDSTDLEEFRGTDGIGRHEGVELFAPG